MLTRVLTVAVLAAGLTGGFTLASAQQLNSRKSANPATNASTARLVTRATLQSEQTENTSLKRDDISDLAVNTSCAPVQIGGEQVDRQGGKPKSLVGGNLAIKDQNTTVVTGDVVNICRK